MSRSPVRGGGVRSLTRVVGAYASVVGCRGAAVERSLGRWPDVRCCYEAGPTGFDLYRHRVERGIAYEVVAPGLVSQRPSDRVKTERRDARKLRASMPAGCSSRSTCP